MIYIIIALLLLVFVILKLTQKSPRQLKGKHVLITGGSSGIGLCVAHDVLKRGAKVTIVARNRENLEKAEKELNKTAETFNKGGGKVVQSFSVDIAGEKKVLAELVNNAESTFGPIYMLVNNAGFAIAARFEDLPEKSVKDMMSINFLGSFFLSQEVVRSMKRREGGGVIVFVSSQAGLFGIYGFTAYSACKGALVKMAEALHMELKPYSIHVCVNFPPDTDTPGFTKENKAGKPVETKLICESAGIVQPDYVAKMLVENSLKGNFLSTVGFEGFLLTTLCAGNSPITDFGALFFQVFLSGIIRVVTAFYLVNFSSIVKKQHDARSQSKKRE